MATKNKRGRSKGTKNKVVEEPGKVKKKKLAKPKKKSLAEIKETMLEVEENKDEILSLADEIEEPIETSDTGYYVTLVCGLISLFVLAFGMLERSRFVALIGGIGFILCLIYVVNGKLFTN